jgi:ATP-dependent Clp protease ATP-binding subunit ClpA
MFERYTERARRVIFFARYEASQFGALAIEAEHLLLGLLREDNQLAHRVLPELHSPLAAIRSEIETRVGVGEKKVPTSVDLPLSPAAKRVLGRAQEESEWLHRPYIGTEHLLLGLLHEEESLAAEILREHGLRIERAREVAGESTPSAPAPTEGGIVGSTVGDRQSDGAVVEDLVEVTLLRIAFGHWSDAARQALFLARCEAGGLGARAVTPEHLLLGVSRVDEPPSIASLERLRDRYADIQHEVEGDGGAKPVPLLVHLPIASATLRAIAHAQEVRERLDHEHLDVEHLLLGLLADGGPRVAEILGARGVTLDVVREEIEKTGRDDDA